MEAEQNQTFTNIDLRTIANLMNQINTMQAQAARNNVNLPSDPNDPYYLHPGESPGTPLISIMLSFNNYHSWKRAMWRALTSKNKEKFVDETIIKPAPDDPLRKAWNRCNNYVVSWINLALSPEIAQSVMWHNVAFDLWQDLKHRYCQGDIFKIAELDDELSSIKQGDLTITAYFTRLNVIWEELENLRPIPQCVACDSNNCLCGLMKVRKYQDDAYVVRFLKGLNDTYSNV
ncbi:uncharacterized protein [Arachis hypogaea]|uniref:uncharacterized protein n=1 Tax=Arachis hypogaea TaxID=3818 RepID=UPI003B21A3A4